MQVVILEKTFGPIKEDYGVLQPILPVCLTIVVRYVPVRKKNELMNEIVKALLIPL